MTTTRRDPLAARTAQPVALASEGKELPIQLAYDYDQVDEAHREQVKGAAVDIKRRTRRAQEDLIVAGQRLNEVKEMLPHGGWENWLNSEFEMSARTAQNMMNVADRFAGKNETVSFLNGSVLYMLAAPSVPTEAVEQVVAEAQATGASPTKARTREIIAKHKPAPAPPRLLTEAEATAVILRVVNKAEARPAQRCDWLTKHHSLSHFTHALTDAVMIENEAFEAAYNAAMLELSDAYQPSPAEVAAATVEPPSAPTCPPDLAAAGWELRTMNRTDGRPPGWWLYNRERNAATKVDDDPGVAIFEAYLKQKGYADAQPAASVAQQARQLRLRGELERWREVLRHVDTIGELTGRFTLALPLRRAVEDVIGAYEENVAE